MYIYIYMFLFISLFILYKYFDNKAKDFVVSVIFKYLSLLFRNSKVTSVRVRPLRDYQDYSPKETVFDILFPGIRYSTLRALP